MASGAKDALVKIGDIALVPDDTFVYFDMVAFRVGFPTALTYVLRALKQHRGSIGSGIWLVEVIPWSSPARDHQSALQ